MPRSRMLTPSASPMHFFGSEVRRAREAAGMTQSELGDLVPCDKATVSRIETGLTQPDEAFARACDAAFPHLDGWFTRFYNGSRTWGEAFPPAFRPFAAVLHREIGGAKVMHDQLLHLLNMAQRPNVTIQVISRIGAHPGLSGAFGIAEMADRHRVVYLETAADGQTDEDARTVANVELRWDTLRTEAFKGTQSLDLLESAAETWKP